MGRYYSTVAHILRLIPQRRFQDMSFYREIGTFFKSWLVLPLKFVNYVSESNLQGFGNPQQDINSGNPVASFNLPHIHWIKIDLFGQFFLGKALRLPMFSDCFAQKFTVFLRNHSAHKPNKVSKDLTDSNSYHFVLAHLRTKFKTFEARFEKRRDDRKNILKAQHQDAVEGNGQMLDAFTRRR
jgi:hypothetical protein